MDIAPSPAWPPTSPTTVQSAIKAYPYSQYRDDDQVTAFFEAYSAYAQGYVDWFNNLNLPIYTRAPVSGALLDWVAQGLYGMSRPTLPSNVGVMPMGPINTFMANSRAVNGFKGGLPETYALTTDDTFRRILTWHLYRGDGRVFTPRWLKRRINRFLNGANGTDVLNDTTYSISVAMSGFKHWMITLPDSTMSQIFKIAVETGAIELPFQITFTIVLV